MSFDRARRNRYQGRPLSFPSWVRHARKQKLQQGIEMPRGLKGLRTMIGADRVEYRPPRQNAQGSARSKSVHTCADNRCTRASTRFGAQCRRPVSASTSRRQVVSPPQTNAAHVSAVWKSWVVPAQRTDANIPVEIAPQFKERVPCKRVASQQQQSALSRRIHPRPCPRSRPSSAPACRAHCAHFGTMDMHPCITGSRVRMHAFGARHGELRAARQAAQLHIAQSHFHAANTVNAANDHCGSNATIASISIYDIDMGRNVVNKGRLSVPSASATQLTKDGKLSPPQPQQLATQPAAVLISSTKAARSQTSLLPLSRNRFCQETSRTHAGTVAPRFAASPTRLGGGFNTLCSQTGMSPAMPGVPQGRPPTTKLAVCTTHAPAFAPSITATKVMPEPRVRHGSSMSCSGDDNSYNDSNGVGGGDK